VVCLTGVGSGGVAPRATADVAAAVVLKNNVVVGSVNANKRHWYKATQALARADRKWLGRLITRRVRPEDFVHALERRADDIKVVIQFSDI
jgi:threonine dehydrogenase-like Zn-dependent dehydrogenase